MNGLIKVLEDNNIKVVNESIYFQVLDMTPNDKLTPIILSITKDNSKNRYSLVNCLSGKVLANDETWKETNKGLTLPKYFSESDIIDYIKKNYTIKEKEV